MSVFPNWQNFAVHQRRSRSGCIPTGYEMILRAAAADGVDFAKFQDDFDLDINLESWKWANRASEQFWKRRRRSKTAVSVDRV